MATSTDPLQRDQIAIVSHDTGDRLQAPSDNAALRLGRALGAIQPALADTLNAISDRKQKDAEAQAKAAALENSGAPLADAVRMGKIKATQNPWFIDAYHRESAAIRGTDALSKLQTDSATWAEKNDPVAFAQKWRAQVAHLTEQFAGDPDSIKGFTVAEAQASQQVLATNQAQNSQRIMDERMQNVSALAADAVQRTVQGNGGHASGSQIAAALAPAKENWIATGGSLEQWNKLAITAVTTASYSLRSPSLLDALKDPTLINGPQAEDDTQYGDGVEGETASLPAPLQPAPPKGTAPLVSPQPGVRLQPPAMGRITSTFAQHTARGSAGVDIAVPNGTKLTTPIGGVAEVGFQKGKGGLFVKIVSPDGKVQQVLAHLSVAQVQNGQHVNPGDVVALSGHSGDATGPHVHWQMKVNGQQVDPLAYSSAQHATDAHHAAVQATPADVPPPPPPATIHSNNPAVGPSLYDIAGVADAVESDRYRIRSAVNSEATDRLQALTADRRLKGLAATDALYSAYGTKILTGDVTPAVIVQTLSKAGYAPQVIAEAMNNIHAAVGDSAGLSTARLELNNSDPSHAKAVFDLATKGRINGYTPEYEHEVGDAILSGSITASDGATMVGEAVSRSNTLREQGRQDVLQPVAPGAVIKKYSQLNAGIDQFVALAAQRISSIGGSQLSPGAQKVQKLALSRVVRAYLADHPGDFAGAEQTARDYIAHMLTEIAGKQGHPITTTAPAAKPAAGGNPRR